MKRLLIVSPHFPPTNAADHQRVRMVLPYLRDLGWAPEVIAVAPSGVLAPVDPFLEATVPRDIPVHRVHGLPVAWSAVPGFGSLAYRCRSALRRALYRRLAEESDASEVVVYFSTTQFPVHAMIPGLRRRFGVKVAIDYQDPWVNDYYARHPEVSPPGGRLKFAIMHRLAQRLERKVVPHVDAFTAVSARYEADFRLRFPVLGAKPFLVLPFGAAETDFQTLAKSEIRQRCFDPKDGRQHWVYAGRGGPDMATAVQAFFAAFRTALSADDGLRHVRLHFIGTDYAAAARARPSIIPLAQQAGVADWVEEIPARIPYGETLRCLTEADALVVPGSDDPGYTASKIYPYILARKPMLTIFHRESSVTRVIDETRCAVSVGFDRDTSPEALAAEIGRCWFSPRAYRRQPSTAWAAFEAYSARTMTGRLARFLASAGQTSTAPFPPVPLRLT